nr:MAG TPA: hypothetical protein [Caudoviricetes sp.]
MSSNPTPAQPHRGIGLAVGIPNHGVSTIG